DLLSLVAIFSEGNCGKEDEESSRRGRGKKKAAPARCTTSPMAIASRCGREQTCIKEASGPVYHLSPGQLGPDAYVPRIQRRFGGLIGRCQGKRHVPPLGKSRTNSSTFSPQEASSALDPSIHKTYGDDGNRLECKEGSWARSPFAENTCGRCLESV